MRIIDLMLITVLILSCDRNYQDNDENVTGTGALDYKAKILKNGLSYQLKGKWINSALFDSTHKCQTLHRWLKQFYTHVLLEINDDQLVSLKGNMEIIDKIEFKTIDSLSFTIPKLFRNSVYTFLPERDLIQFEDKWGRVLFRRIQKKDSIQIIHDREKFNTYFITRFFTDDYFRHSKKPQIDYIWNGFETHNPFSFDAVGITNNKGEMDFYGWQIAGDTLDFYYTTWAHNDDGFAVYKKGKLYKRYIKTGKGE
jgi:hypothetical protein